MAIPFADKAAQTGYYDPDSLLDYLKGYYSDPDTNRRALERLRRIRQKKSEPFAAFLPRFEKELIKNNGAAWPDHIKILYLKRALSAKLTDRLITTPLDRQNYPDIVKVI